MSRIGFIGIGVMGLPMARNLIKGGFHVAAFDLNPDALEAIRREGAAIADSAAHAADEADVVITMLPNGEHVRAAVLGPDGATETMAEGALLVDMSTILPTVTDELGAEMVRTGRRMVDAPVGRSSQHAVEGTLLIMVGGEAGDVEDARPLLACMGDTIIHCGPLGSGARMKLVNNFMSIAGNVVTAEALTLAERSGLDRDLAVEVMMGTTAGLGHLSTTYPAKVLQGDLTPGFMVDLASKDIGLALELADHLRMTLPMGEAAQHVYQAAQADGRGRQDWTAIYEAVRGRAGADGAAEA